MKRSNCPIKNATKIVLLWIIGFSLNAARPLSSETQKSNKDYPCVAAYLARHPTYQGYQAPVAITKHGCKWGEWITFPQKIEAIQARVGTIKEPGALFLSKDFLMMYKHPEYYKKAMLDYLFHPNYSLKQKEIVLYANANSSQGFPTWLCEAIYAGYKDAKIDPSLLESTFAIVLSNWLHRIHKYPWLEQVTKAFDKDPSWSNKLKAILSKKVPEAWEKHIMNGYLPKYYYDDQLPFLEVIRHAERERQASDTIKFGGYFTSIEVPPYLLMVLEHPAPYYHGHFDDSADVKNGTRVLRDPSFTSEEKSMAIWGISQLGVFSSEESGVYINFIARACEAYQKGQITVGHLQELFQCKPNYHKYPFKYPFFILDYKCPSIQHALNEVIAMPTIPCGIKEMARKVKNGTLATKEEMAYMEGYRQFRKNHFTLYETIPPK